MRQSSVEGQKRSFRHIEYRWPLMRTNRRFVAIKSRSARYNERPETATSGIWGAVKFRVFRFP